MLKLVAAKQTFAMMHVYFLHFLHHHKLQVLVHLLKSEVYSKLLLL